MDEQAQARLACVLALAAEDESYRQLQRRCELLDQSFLTVLESLPEEHRAVVLEYVRTMGAAALRLTEIACERT